MRKALNGQTVLHRVSPVDIGNPLVAITHVSNNGRQRHATQNTIEEAHPNTHTT